MKFTDLPHYNPGYSSLDCPILDGDLFNGSYQTSYSNSNDLVSKFLVTNILTPQRSIRISSSHIRERRTVTKRIVSSLGQVYFKSLYKTIDKSIVSTMETQRVQGSGKTLGQRICVESRCEVSYEFSVWYTTVAQPARRHASPAPNRAGAGLYPASLRQTISCLATLEG